MHEVRRQRWPPAALTHPADRSSDQLTVVEERSLVSGPSELSEHVMQPSAPGGSGLGPPGIAEPGSVTVVPVGSDGILRAHPH